MWYVSYRHGPTGTVTRLEYQQEALSLRDSSSVKAFVRRCDLGRMKHIQTRFLWIQERLALKHFVLSKVSTLLNRADYLTKQLSAKEM